MRKNAVLSYDAKRTLNDYYENVQGLHYTDMQQRVFHYHRIINVLTNIDVFFDEVKSWNNSLVIDIDNICKVQFVIESNETEIFVEEIYFKHDIHQWQTYHY